MPVKYIGGDDAEWQAFCRLKEFARSLGVAYRLGPDLIPVLLVNVATEFLVECSLDGRQQENADGLKQAIQDKLDHELADRAIGRPQGSA